MIFEFKGDNAKLQVLNFIERLPTVKKVPVEYKFDERMKTAMISDRFYALVNPLSGYLYSIVSDRYKPVNHADVIRLVENALSENNINVEQRILKYNDKYATTIRYDIVFEKRQVANELLWFGISVKSSYDGETAIALNGISIRGVCSNLMVFGKAFMSEYVCHLRNPIDKLLRTAIPTVVESFDLIEKKVKKAMETDINVEALIDIITKVNKSLTFKAIFEKYYREETGHSVYQYDTVSLWSAYNALTRALTHDTHIKTTWNVNSVYEANKRFAEYLLSEI